MRGVALFDLDGTLLDADHIHHQAWQRMVAPHGVELTAERYRAEVMGVPNDLIVRNLLPGLPLEHGLALADKKEALFRELATRIDPAEGLVAFLDWLDERGAGYGVVTNAPRANAEHELGGIGLAERFDVLVIGPELEHSKPHPLPYLTGLHRMGACASHSIAFEDSLSGLKAAKAAGLMVVGMTTGHTAEQLLDFGADLAVPHFADARLRPFVAARLDGVIRAAAVSA